MHSSVFSPRLRSFPEGRQNFMYKKFFSKFISIVAAVITVVCLIAYANDYKIAHNWIETEGTVLSAVKDSQQNEQGRDSVCWRCDVAYTREDGTESIAKNIAIRDSVSKGSKVSVIYNPASKRAKEGPKPSESDLKLALTMIYIFVFVSAASGILWAVFAVIDRKKALNNASENKTQENTDNN